MLLLSPYMDGTRFQALKEHDALRWSIIMNYATGKLERWLLSFLEIEFLSSKPLGDQETSGQLFFKAGEKRRGQKG